MSDIVDIEAKQLERMEADIHAQFVAIGGAQIEIQELTVSIEQWRRSARAVGRRLRRPVKTLVGGGIVHAFLTDWPRDDSERATREDQLRKAGAAVSLSLRI